MLRKEPGAGSPIPTPVGVPLVGTLPGVGPLVLSPVEV